jgi:protein O-mannose beta-1,4-N-acetylglucosaminyltransferase
MHILFLTFLIILLILKWKISKISLIDTQLDSCKKKDQIDVFRIERENFSNMYCSSDEVSHRMCRIGYLYLENKDGTSLLRIHHFLSLFLNINSDGKRFLDLSSVDDHSSYYWNYKTKYNHIGVVHTIFEKSQLIKRFLPNNLMHIIHDDWLGVKYLQEYERNESRTVIFLDSYPSLNIKLLDSIYDSLGRNFQYEKSKYGEGITQFKDVIVGNSKALTWYQYGFRGMQGPILNSYFNGDILRRILSKKLWDGFETGKRKITIFSRTKNRKIVNENDLLDALRKKVNQTVVKLSLETYLDQEFTVLAKEINESKVIIGMHGSLFAMIPWLPEGAIVIEIFPYAVQAKNYTPYKTLCELLNIEYYAIETLNKNMTIEYPNRPRLLGGITHLNEYERRKILESTQVPPHRCCQNPEWLFRIYQDTVVDIEAVLNILKPSRID